MKYLKKQMGYALIFISISITIFSIQYVIFKDKIFILENLMWQMGFLPIYIFLTSIVLESIITRKQKAEMLQKLNMVIGAFFSEVGNDLITLLTDFHIGCDKISKEFIINQDWNEDDFKRCIRKIKETDIEMDSKLGNMNKLQKFLEEKKAISIAMLSNSNLLEHESFTELLWAVSHLAEELQFRNDLNLLCDEDYQHLSVDLKRAYQALILEWIYYMKHLKEEYPYLYALSVIKNPFLKVVDK